MSTNTLMRWGGLAALVGGAAFVALDLAEFATTWGQPMSVAASTVPWVARLLLRLVALVLAMLGLAALYAHQTQEAGRLGVVAFVAATAGTMLIFGYIWTGTFAAPPLAQAAPEFLDAAEAMPPGMFFVGVILTFVVGPLGWFLFGLASLRAVVLPPVSAWLVMVGGIVLMVLTILMAPFALTVLGVGLAWMGWWLWLELAPAP